MDDEPGGGLAGDLVERAGFLEQVAGARHDLQAVEGGQPPGGPAVERQDPGVGAAHDQQRGRRYALQGRAGQVRSAAAGDHRSDPVGPLGRGHQGGGRTRAGPEQPQARRSAEAGGQPVDGTRQASGEQPDVEAKLAAAQVELLLIGSEQVQQRGVPRPAR